MQEKRLHLNNLFRGSSCLTPGGFLLSIDTVLLPIFKSEKRFVVVGKWRVNVSKLASTLSSVAWYAGLLTPLVMFLCGVCGCLCLPQFVLGDTGE